VVTVDYARKALTFLILDQGCATLYVTVRPHAAFDKNFCSRAQATCACYGDCAVKGLKTLVYTVQGYLVEIRLCGSRLGSVHWRTQKNLTEVFIQWHIAVICIWYALFATSQFNVIFMFPNQRFGEVC